jgi:hypothetical protein
MTYPAKRCDAASHRRSRAFGAVLLGGFVLLVAACSSRSAAEPAATNGSTTSGSATAAARPAPGATSGPAARTKIVPAPNGGNIHQHVRSGVAHTAAPVPMSHVAHFGRGVSVRIVKHTIINAKAKGPGEISGPAMALTIHFVNASKRSVDLNHVVVNDQDAKGTPLLSVANSASPVAGSVAAGATKTGVYVFTLPRVRHNPYTISISYSTAAPVVRLVGVAA